MAQLSIEQERIFVRTGLQKSIVENTERFLKINLAEDDLEAIKELVEAFESNLYTAYLRSFKISSCNAKIGRPDLMTIDLNYFQNNSTAFIDESNEQNVEVDSANYCPATSLKYRNNFYRYASQVSMLGYSREAKNLINIELDLFYRIFAIDAINGAEIQLSADDTFKLHKEFLRQLYVGINGKEREEAIGDPEVSVQFRARASSGFNPLSWFKYVKEPVEGSGYIRRALDSINPLNYRFSVLTQEINARINTRNGVDIVDNLGHRYIVKASFFGKELVIPNNWQKIQSNLANNKEQINRFKLNEFPFIIDSNAVTFSSISLFQNFLQLFDYEKYKENFDQPLQEVRVFYSAPAPQRNVCISKKIVLDLYECLKSSCRINALNIDQLKKEHEEEIINFSIDINRTLKNALDKQIDTPPLINDLNKLLEEQLTKKNSLNNILYLLENGSAQANPQLIESLNKLAVTHHGNIGDLRKIIAAFKQYEQNTSVLNNYAKAIRQRYLENFETAEQRLGALNEIKELFPALKAESSFSKADRYAYSRIGSPGREQGVMRAQFRKAFRVFNQTEQFVNENFATILADDLEVDCVINEDNNGDLTYYFKNQDQVMIEYVIIYTDN